MDLLPWKVSRLNWDLPKSEKIPAMLYIGKEPVFKPFSYTFIPFLSRSWVKF
jgi:hypothetical protein